MGREKIKNYVFNRFRHNKIISMYLLIEFFNVKEDVNPDIETISRKLQIDRTTALKRINELVKENLVKRVRESKKYYYKVS